MKRDDGYSGINYNRPDFQWMLNLVEDGQVGIVIVKDLSRRGRDYLLTGYYTDIIELTEELLHTLIEKVVVHEKEVIDGETVMRIDIYYRFISNVGNEDDGILITPKTRRASIPLAPGA